ncbi:MAG: hypothetical protein HZB18_17075 [Chloroflexi bacterium]|nr:hypothetical protein [Chloroflexota bacterium]
MTQERVDVMLHDAMRRAVTTARRVTLFQILWNERYLTRDQLMIRMEYRLGRNCFGSSAEDTFYRDMRVVKQEFQAAGHVLEYSRNPKKKDII